jgi:hypothetical protein
MTAPQRQTEVRILDLEPGQVLTINTASGMYTVIMTNKREATRNGFVRNVAVMPRSYVSQKPRDEPASTEIDGVIKVNQPLTIANSKWSQIELGIVTSLFLH